MKAVCIKNESNRKELIIGNSYEIFEHDNPAICWVRIDEGNTFYTIQAYISDFKAKSPIGKKLTDL